MPAKWKAAESRVPAKEAASKKKLLSEITKYKISASLYFILTFTIIGFSIVSLVQGFVNQFDGKTTLAFAYYFATPLLVFVSYIAYMKAHYKLRVIAMAR
ncbi:MAG: hypothetical protein NTW59_02935 [Candidatus Diapherotrites archaeon]|nr:hypothetical protein [Candidatus Diapherotrites archaeon]